MILVSRLLMRAKPFLQQQRRLTKEQNVLKSAKSDNEPNSHDLSHNSFYFFFVFSDFFFAWYLYHFALNERIICMPFWKSGEKIIEQMVRHFVFLSFGCRRRFIHINEMNGFKLTLNNLKTKNDFAFFFRLVCICWFLLFQFLFIEKKKKNWKWQYFFSIFANIH